MAVQLPGYPVSDEKDLLPPAAEYMRGLAVLENDPAANADERRAVSSRSAFDETPYSLQVITAGTLALSKTATRFVAGLGGIAGIAGAVSGFWIDLPAGPQAAALGGAALLLASAFVSIAIIVRADVLARSQAQAAQYEARGRIAAEFLDTTAKPVPMPAPKTLWIKHTGANNWCEVSHWAPDTENGVVAVLKDPAGTRIPVVEITRASLG
jgi:hypothetical protein